MKKILSLLIGVFAFLFLAYYVLFFIQYDLPFTLNSNKAFVEALSKSPLTLLKTITPGTVANKTMKEEPPTMSTSPFKAVGDEDLGDSPQLPIRSGTVVDLKPKDVDEVATSFYNFMMGDVGEGGWSWKVDLLSGDVIGKDLDQRLLGLQVFVPEKESPNDLMSFIVECARENSILVSRENLDVLEYGINFLDRVVPGDTVYVSCLDSECTSIGNGCVLIQTNEGND